MRLKFSNFYIFNVLKAFLDVTEKIKGPPYEILKEKKLVKKCGLLIRQRSFP